MKNRLNILLVDDEATILELFSEMLSELGHRVTVTEDPGVALRIGSREKFDIAFLDQFLGHTRGLDLMQDLAAQDPDLSFVIVTASGSTDLAVESLQRGASDFLTKPFFENDVIHSIDLVCKKRDQERRRQGLMTELELRVKEKTDELIQVNFSVLAALAGAMEKKDLGTYGHSLRVSGHADRIAESLRLTRQERDDLHAAAMLHDIGKIGISDSILGKPGPLTSDEMAVVRRHTENGVEILRPLRHYQSILPAILHHHEHYDGNGYPHGLSGESIPLLARIISVADTYDAILSDRPYRSAADEKQALDVLEDQAGKQFDPAAVKGLVASLAGRGRPAISVDHAPAGLPTAGAKLISQNRSGAMRKTDA
jgi:putative nucleotidyltransferase with HDIG domain